MKRALSLILALALVLGCLPRFALPVGAESTGIENLRYDDHMDMTGRTVEILDAGMPISYQVGYGVEENAVADTAVVTMRGDTLVATGIGTARVKIDGEVHEITVTAAPISLLLLIGQSNMRGSEGNADQSIVCPDGMVYATFGDDRGDAEGIMNVTNATNFAASALTGEYSTVNVNGITDNLSYYPINSLTEAGKGTFGPDSGFAYEWVKQTGEKVWVVNAAHGGSSITSWQPNAANFKEAVLLFGACQETLRREIAAGHYTLSHMGYFWCQGCSDYNWTAEKYVTNYLAMHNGLKESLAFDHDSSDATDPVIFEFAGIIPVRAGHDYNDGYREDVYTDTISQKFYESFLDLQMTGPRVAQYWMCNNPDLEDIWMVCNAGEDWVWMPDGTNGVTDYFQSHYENGTVDYTTQVAQKASWYTPTTPAAVHDSIHYNQIGYNEVGRESARNALIMLGEIQAPEVETTVELVSWDGYTPANQISAFLTGNSSTLVVPKVSPVWESKNVEYTLSDGFTWSYYDILTSDEGLSGRLTMGGQTVVIDGHNWSDWETLYVASADGPGREQRICSHCDIAQTREIDGVWQIYDLADHLLELPEHVCCDTNLWTALPHEDVHFTSGKTWGRTSTPVTSITIPVDPGDRLYATSWQRAVENGHATSNGIRVTFFDAKGIAKTLGPGQTDREFYANGGYLVAPEGSIAINIAMWYDSEDYEVYILNREHIYEAVTNDPTCTQQGYTTHTCGGCGDSYVDSVMDPTGEHAWGEWMEVTAPTCTAKGYTTHACACGESFVDSYVNANGHSYGAWKVTVAPTCTEVGTERKDCAVCGDYEMRPVAASGHDYKTTVTVPTCTAQGYTTHTCHCGSGFVDSYMEPIGHSWSGWVVVEQPTNSHSGIQERTCMACDDRERQELPRLEILYGDANGDGQINALDLILMRQHLAGWNVTVDATAADVTGDGRCNALDLIRLRQYLAGWDVVLGP